MKKSLPLIFKILLVSVLLPLSDVVSAASSPEEIDLLRQQIELLTKRLDKLEEESKTQVKAQAQVKSVAASTVVTRNVKKVVETPAKKSMLDRLSFKADFRDRFELIDHQGRQQRERNRVRLRAALAMQVYDDLSFTLGLATGTDDPVSTNQTLGSGFSSEDMRLNLAFFDYKINDALTLIGGKMNNPFYRPGKNSTFWDSDLNPEGFAFKFDNGFVHGSLVGFSVEERKASADSLLLGGQIMHGFKLTKASSVLIGAGYYDYSGLQGHAPIFDGKPRGNLVDNNGNLINDFNIIEALMEYKTQLMGKPLSFFGNYFQNIAADNLNTAYTFGFKYGKVKAAGSWDIGLAYLDTEADAVLALFNDSDFAGGNTDAKGLSFKMGYGIRKNMAMSLTLINSEFGQSQPTQTNYDRLQLDFKLKFK